MNRRQFLLSAPMAAGLAGAETGLKIRQVDIVHHTHTDVGYTEFPVVVRDLQRRYIDVAVDACRADRNFRWTVESLVDMDDWWRASSAARRDEFLGLVKTGRIDVMAMPFNQTPFMNAMQWRQMMNWIPANLWKSLNIRAAMQNDVNGIPRAGAIALLNHGISHFLMGLNWDSGGPPFQVPDAFWWKMPDGRKLFVWLGEHYGSVMRYLQPARDGHHMKTDEQSVRAAHKSLVERLQKIEAQGYAYDRILFTFTNPLHYDNGGPFPSVAPFIAAWNRLGLKPTLRMATATEAIFDMEKVAGSRAPVLEGEWTDWWANGDASGPREVAASRFAKRYMSAAMSPVFGPMPLRAKPQVEDILKDLCLFDEHTWGASGSIREPYGLKTIAQYGEKSDLAYKPMGMAEALLSRRVRATIDPLPDGLYVVNAAPAEVSGWVPVAANAVTKFNSVVDAKTGESLPLVKDRSSVRLWVDKVPANSIRQFRPDAATATDKASAAKPAVKVDASGWPVSASWAGMRKPLFDGALGEFICAGVIAPADRRTLSGLHGNTDAAKREAIRKASLRQTSATYGQAELQETPHTLSYGQEIRHERLAKARRTLELWKREPRARITVKFDRVSSLDPEVLYLDFALPEGVPLPVFSSGGVPFTPYRDQLKGSCKDYFGIDGWAHYPTSDGHWLWVTRDAPLVSVGAPHFVEIHQQEPADHRRILAMIFDNCWHTNFVADSHGTMEFRFELAWKENIAKPADLAEALAADPIVLMNQAPHEEAPVINNLFRP